MEPLPIPRRQCRLRFKDEMADLLHDEFYENFGKAWATLNRQNRNPCTSCRGDGKRRPIIRGLESPCLSCHGTGMRPARPMARFNKPSQLPARPRTMASTTEASRVVTEDCREHYSQNKGSWLHCKRERWRNGFVDSFGYQPCSSHRSSPQHTMGTKIGYWQRHGGDAVMFGDTCTSYKTLGQSPGPAESRMLPAGIGPQLEGRRRNAPVWTFSRCARLHGSVRVGVASENPGPGTYDPWC
eukprot:TRINITY_DN28969_c0_g1_i1.p1 TRINITY_DN28969_c0_g1~~TRINITY_DN28969_c0_g1_i1.p1  ORF type:complete len:241 (-),score=11.01 TRINITY_DN28969_c0_g1_i1:16-738(-)